MEPVKLLYTNGCSFVRMVSFAKGGTVVHPTDSEQWPALLGQKLGADVVNDGMWNGSNPRIFRTTLNFVDNLTVDPKDVFAIISFTVPHRFEYKVHRPVTDYIWRECPEKSNWVRVNPAHGVGSTAQPHSRRFPKGSLALTGDDFADHTISYPGKYKAYSKLLNYDPETEFLDFYKHILAVDAILAQKNIRRKYLFNGWIFSVHSTLLDKIRNTVPHFLDEQLIRLAEGNCSIDGTHADHLGNKITADRLYELIQ